MAKDNWSRVMEIHHATDIKGPRDNLLCWFSDHPVTEVLIAFAVAAIILTIVTILVVI